MRAAIFVVALSLLAGCGWVLHPIDYNARTAGKIDVSPQLMLRLSVSDQTCANKDGFARVSIFITIVAAPVRPINITINGSHSYTLVGESVTLEIQRAGIGSHTIQAVSGDLSIEKSFSVWQCSGSR